MKQHRMRTGDEGSIAVMAAVIVPVVLLVIALAMATLVWATSETETQRAADEGAVQAAASALLIDYPYSSVSTAGTLYPTLRDKVPTGTLPALTPCESLSNPVDAVSGLTTSTTTTVLGVTTTVLSPIDGLLGTTPEQQELLSTLPTSCSSLTAPLAPIPNQPVTSRREACDTAAEAMRGASYALRFYDGPASSSEPTCANGRIRAGFSTQSPLIGFGSTTVGAGGGLQLSVPSELTAVQNALAPLGVRLDTTLPNAVCPQVNVEVDQPVQEPVFDRSSTPNGRATAKRVVKNAVVVPVFNGMGLASAQAAVHFSADGIATVTGSGATEVRLPAQNLNTTLLAEQKRLLALLDQMDAAINARLAAANVTVTQLNGTVNAVTATAGAALGVPTPALSTNLGSLSLLKCLRDTVSQVFDPPSGDAPTMQEVLAAAAAAGEPVHAIQVGALPCADDSPADADALSCVQAATGTIAGSATGLYDIPFLDVTPVLVKDVGNGNYQAVPVHASQASGAFRATLVRSATDSRYAPRVVSP